MLKRLVGYTHHAWTKPLVCSVMVAVLTCTSTPLQVFAPAAAYAATPVAAELSAQSADAAKAQLLTAFGATLPGLEALSDDSLSLAQAVSENVAEGGASLI